MPSRLRLVQVAAEHLQIFFPLALVSRTYGDAGDLHVPHGCNGNTWLRHQVVAQGKDVARHRGEQLAICGIGLIDIGAQTSVGLFLVPLLLERRKRVIAEKEQRARGTGKRLQRHVMLVRFGLLGGLDERVFRLLMSASALPRLEPFDINHQNLGRRCRLRAGLLCPGSGESDDSADTETQSCTYSNCLAQHTIPSLQREEAVVALRGCQRWGKGPLLGASIGGKPGDLPTAKRTKAKKQGPDTTLSSAAYKRDSCRDRIFPVRAVGASA